MGECSSSPNNNRKKIYTWKDRPGILRIHSTGRSTRKRSPLRRLAFLYAGENLRSRRGKQHETQLSARLEGNSFPESLHKGSTVRSNRISNCSSTFAAAGLFRVAVCKVQRPLQLQRYKFTKIPCTSRRLRAGGDIPKVKSRQCYNINAGGFKQPPA